MIGIAGVGAFVREPGSFGLFVSDESEVELQVYLDQKDFVAIGPIDT